MPVEVVILGSGTSVPCADRRPPALLLRCAGVSLLFDCGAGTSTALAAAGVSLGDLASVFLTHFHLDHTAELPAMLFALRNPRGPSRRSRLWIRGPAGTPELLDALRRAHGSAVEPRGPTPRAATLTPGRAVRLGPFTVRAFAVQHSGACFAYRVQAAGKTVCYSGDSGVCPGLLRAAREADLLVCECAALEDEGLAGHLSADEVGRVAAAARCGAVVLTHLYPWIAASAPVARVQRHFTGPVIVGFDGLRLVGRRRRAAGGPRSLRS